MWLMTRFGFFSVVEKPGDGELGMLTVRSRVRADLESLGSRYLSGQLGPIVSSSGSDYRYRARVPRSALASALFSIVNDIDYSNFKNAVADSQGWDRARVYHDVWAALLPLQKESSSGRGNRS